MGIFSINGLAVTENNPLCELNMGCTYFILMFCFHVCRHKIILCGLVRSYRLLHNINFIWSFQHFTLLKLASNLLLRFFNYDLVCHTELSKS